MLRTVLLNLGYGLARGGDDGGADAGADRAGERGEGEESGRSPRSAGAGCGVSEWGRKERMGWPARKPVHTFTASLLGGVAAVVIGGFCYRVSWGPLERYYFPTYTQAMLSGWITRTGEYRLLEVGDARGRVRPALGDDVAAGETEILPSFRAPLARYPRTKFCETPNRFVYGGRALSAVVSPALWGALVVFARQPAGEAGEHRGGDRRAYFRRGLALQLRQWRPARCPPVSSIPSPFMFAGMSTVARDGIEPPTRGFSVRCSTD